MQVCKEEIRQKISEIDDHENQLLAELNKCVGIREVYITLLSMDNIPETIEDKKEVIKDDTLHTT